MRPGPAPQPTAMKVAKGTDRPCRKIPNEMDFQPLVKAPRAPKHFNKRAKKEWRNVCSNLIAIKMLYLVDLPQLQAYCFQVSIMQTAEIKLSTTDHVVKETNKGGHEYNTKSKWMSIYNESLDRVNKLGREFGFTPSSRTRISMLNLGQNATDKHYLGNG